MDLPEMKHSVKGVNPLTKLTLATPRHRSALGRIYYPFVTKLVSKASVDATY